MRKDINTVCIGAECPVKKQCLLHSMYKENTNSTELIRKCTNQKRFVQDKEQIVKGR